MGEKVQIMWKQRTSPIGSMFCQVCGEKVILEGRVIDSIIKDGEAEISGDFYTKHLTETNCANIDADKIFNKILGVVEITDVFKIEMWAGNDAPLVSGYRLKDTYDLARRDGFSPGSDGKYTDFYNFFMKNYGFLEEPKPFWVYRW